MMMLTCRKLLLRGQSRRLGALFRNPFLSDSWSVSGLLKMALPRPTPALALRILKPGNLTFGLVTGKSRAQVLPPTAR